MKDKYDAIRANEPNLDFSEKNTLIDFLKSDPQPLFLDDALYLFNEIRNAGRLDELGITTEVSDRMDTLWRKFFGIDNPRTWLTDSEQIEVSDFVNDLYERNPGLSKQYTRPGFSMPNGHSEFTPEFPTVLYYKNYLGDFGQLKVVGFYKNNTQSYSEYYFVSENFIETKALPYEQEDKNQPQNTYYQEIITDYKLPDKAYYSGMITPAGYSQEQIEFMEQNYGSACKLNLTNSIARTVASNLSLINILRPTFLGIGAGLAVFAALMLLNYVSTSIATKTKEIGILRAVGARGSDLFKIFFSESGLMSAICVVISIVASIITVFEINKVFMSGLMKVALLNFGVLNVLLIIVGAIIIAILGTIVPVIIASKKQPVESIRTL